MLKATIATTSLVEEEECLKLGDNLVISVLSCATHLKDDRTDKSIHGSENDILGRLEAPQHDPSFAKEYKKVQHGDPT